VRAGDVQEFRRAMDAPMRELADRLKEIDILAAALGPDFDKAGATVDAVTQAMQRLAAAQRPMTKELQDQSNRLREMARLQAVIGGLFDSIGNAFAGTVQGLLQGTQTVSQAFQNMGRNIVTSLINTVIHQGIDQVKKALAVFLAELEKSGLIKAGLAGLSALFGVATTPSTTAPAAEGFTPGLSEFATTVPARQHGGLVTRPELALLGEAGPELVIPLRGLGGSRGGGTQINIYNQAPDVEVTHRQREGPRETQIHDLVVREVKRMVGTGEFDTIMTPYSLRRVPTSR